MILKAYKYRLYPTKKQQILLDKHIGACRFIYNLALETKQMAYIGNKVNLSCFDLMNQIPELRKECTWLNEIGGQSLQQAIINVDKSYTNFFKGRADYPKFKSKRSGKQSFSIPQRIKIIENKLIIPKFLDGINIILDRQFCGKIKTTTISKTPTGKYFASLLIETNLNMIEKKPITEENTIGIDLGLKNFLITSDSEIIQSPKYLIKNSKKINYLQSRYGKYKSEKNRQKLALIYEKVTNQRKDFLHKVSTKLIRENQSIALETLDIKNMIKNHKVARSIKDASWGTFIQMLEYKAEWYGTNIIKIGKFEPSSKTCSNCGHTNKELTLKDRTWTCKHCNSTHDRDINAAINIKNFGLKKYLSTEHTLKNQSELPTLVGVMTSEASQS